MSATSEKLGVEHQIAKAVGSEIEDCHEYGGDLMVFSLKDGRILNILLERSIAQLTSEDGAVLGEYKIKVTLE